MHQSLVSIQQNLETLIERVRQAVPNNEPFGNAHGNWSFPGLTRDELIESVQLIVDTLHEQGMDEVGDSEQRLSDYIRRIQHLRDHTVPQLWGNAGQAVPVFLITLEGLRRALFPVLSPEKSATDIGSKIRILTNKLRSMESKLKDLGPRAESLSVMIERIEQAYSAADQLPTDLESLSEGREKLINTLSEAKKIEDYLCSIKVNVDKMTDEIDANSETAKDVLKKCETAYSAATSVGLSAAFSERSKALSSSIMFWVVGLILALGIGSYLGSGQLHILSGLLKDTDVSISLVVINLMLSFLSISAPVWFAWLATKQIGQRFKLAEDYAFKASISRAYEGFRREAARIDTDMEARLLASALARFDELPLRLIDGANHNSPWHELLSSETIKQTVKAVPDIASQVKDFAGKTVDSLGGIKSDAHASHKEAN